MLLTIFSFCDRAENSKGKRKKLLIINIFSFSNNVLKVYSICVIKSEVNVVTRFNKVEGKYNYV